MRTSRIIPLQDVNEWRNTICTVPHGIAHTWEHCYAMQLTSGLETFLYHFADGDTRIICAFAERQFDGTTDIVSPPGFAGFVGCGWNPAALECWSQMMSQHQYICGYLALHPTLSDPSWFGPEARHYGTAYILDLAPPIDSIYSSLSRNRKRELRSADREGIRVWIGGSAVKQFFVRHFSEVTRQRNAKSVYHLSPTTLDFLCTLDNFLLVGAGRHEVESVTAFAFTSYAAESLYNLSFSPRKSYSTVITWAAAEILHSKKIPVLNLGAGLSPGVGWGEYKRRLGTWERPMYCLKQVYDRPRFVELCALAGTVPDDWGGYFPPYRTGIQ